MKALVWKGNRKLELEERPKPEPLRGEALVKTAYVGICGTDMDIYEGQGTYDLGYKPPRILGHEISGVVAGIGREVQGIKTGERVAVNPVFNCGECDLCRSGRPHLCTGKVQLFGAHRDGGLAEYIVLPATKLFRLPQQVSLKEGCLMEPLACVLTAYEMVTRKESDNVVILGCGLAGLLFVQVVKLQGAGTVLITGTREERLAAARRLGADKTICVKKNDLPAEISSAIGKEGIDIVVEAAGSAGTIRQAINVVKKGGQILIYGAPAELVNDVDFRLVNSKGITIYGGVGPGNTFEEAIRLVAAKKIRLKEIITHEFNLRDAGRAFEVVRNREGGVIKAVINVAETNED